ncbi:MAG: metal-dependent hydrolase [Verrucomicrobiota bacterium]|jgi:L-ascorbate metabolism protein UlaG (beta-lactamase superfamily)
MNVTFYGHACFAVELGVDTLLFDPFITPNSQASGVDLKSVRADYILVSHGHQDHLADAVEVAKRTGATVIANFEVATWLEKNGVARLHAMNHGGPVGFEFGRVRMVNAIHSSSLPDGSYGGNPGGFVVESAHGNFYYSGDTALTMDMKLIGESTRLTFAALCVGGNFTMDAEDAAKAAGFVQCDEVLGVHYDTYPPIKINHEEAIRRFEAVGKKLHLLKIGESHNF